MVSKSKGLLVVTLLFLVCISTYFNTLFYDFVFDDRSLVVENPYIKSSKYIGEAFKKDLWDFAYEGSKPNYYRPLQTFSFMLDYRFWKLAPFGYHLTNIFLHLSNGLLVFALIYLLFNNFFIATTSSLLFCTHPVNSSVVTYISSRADLLAGAFILFTLLFSILSLKAPKDKKLYFVFAIFSSLAAFLSRENALVIPLAVILIFNFIDRKPKNKTLLLLFIILSASLYLYWRLILLGIPFTREILLNLNIFLRLLNFFYALVLYIILLIIPFNLYLTHTAMPILSWSDPRAPVILTLFTAGLIFWYIKRHNKILNFGLTWFFIFVFQVFFVMNGFSRDRFCMAENWIYIAAIGFYVIISYLLYILMLRHKTTAYWFIAALLLAYATITISNNSNFKDRISLASHMLKFDPGNKESHKELAMIYLENKEYASASEHIDQALKSGPRDPDLYILKGIYYEDTGNIKSAVASYRELLKIEPNSARAYNNLGAIYLNKGDLEQAGRFFTRAIELNPLLAEPYLNMAKIYLDKRDFRSAINVLNRALICGHRTESVLVFLGIANGELGFDNKSNYYFSEALKLKPKSMETILNMGVFYAKRGQLDKAIEIWQKGLLEHPENKIIKENINKAKGLLLHGGVGSYKKHW